MISDERLYVSVKSAALLTDLSDATIRDAINKQKLPAFRVGRSPRISVADLDVWVRGHVLVGSEDDR